MKRNVSILAAALALCACSSHTPRVDSNIELGATVMPYPRHCEYSTGVLYLDNSLVSVSSRFGSRTFDYVNEFAERLSRCSSSEVEVSSFRFKPAKGSSIAICYDGSLPDEAYELKVDENGARISSSSHNGVVYAIATIRQMLPPAIFSCDAPSESPEDSGTDWMIPFCDISDAPAYGYRGVHLDCARHFFPVEKVKKYLDIMSQYKFNRFHWHLTDDQGWRIESRKYPKLTEIGSVRAGTMVGMDWDSDDGIPHGGYYTQDELRDVVAYADRLGITIVPEIDLPGHMVAALASYPELGCTGGPYEVRKTWGIAEDVLCAGKEETYRFLEDILGEVADIFPGEIFHIGGDECPKTAWKNCPHCQAKIAELGLEDKDGVSAEQYLQNYVTHRVQQMLAAKGKRVMGWDEITEGNLDKGVTVMFWRGWLPVEKTIRAYVANGYDVVMTPNSFCYLDYVQSEDRQSEPVGYGVLTLEKMYSFDMTKSLSPEELSHVKGIQGNLWTEFTQTWDDVEYMLLPRLFALSCLAWDADDRPDYETFLKDVQSHQIPILNAWGINFRNFTIN